MLFGAVVMLTKGLVLPENLGIMFGNQALLLDLLDTLSAPFLAKFAIISVKISITRSSASSGSSPLSIFSPVIVFRSKTNPKSSP